MQDARDRLIVALDFPTQARALSFAERLDGQCRWVKVGLELYLAAGPGIIPALRELGFQVFLDLKLHDIPNTVAGAVRSLARSGASLLTIHAAGGPAMLAAAQGAAQAAPDGPELLAVTVLTSMDQAQLASIGVSGGAADQVSRLAALAHPAGVRGLVCSPEEVSRLRAELGGGTRLVVPGIRPANYGVADDQSRVATPGQAIAAGASMLVVGRPITQAADPAAATAAILAEMAAAARAPSQ